MSERESERVCMCMCGCGRVCVRECACVVGAGSRKKWEKVVGFTYLT